MNNATALKINEPTTINNQHKLVAELQSIDNIKDHDATSMWEAFDTMEQGIVVWSKTGVCELFNQQFIKVNNLQKGDIFVGRKRIDFFNIVAERRKMAAEDVVVMNENYLTNETFKLDLATGFDEVIRIVGHPTKSGGFVVTYWSVTESRRNQAELDIARQAAEEAETKARGALATEQRRKHESRLLGELGEWLQSCKSLDELFNVISKFMEKLFPETSGELYIYSNSRDVLEGACAWGDHGLHNHIHADDCWALRRGRIFKYGSGLVDFHCTHAEDNDSKNSERYMCLPIVAHGDTVGLLHIDFDSSLRESTEDPIDQSTHGFALQCSEQISLAIANVKLRDELRDQSTKDPLTGLFNRRYFLETCRRDFSTAERKGHSVGLLVFDADNFKTFNDNHGHDAGDMVLRGIGDVMHNLCTNGETPCRYGGEEFAILVPDSSLETTAAFAEQLRSEVEELTIHYGEKDLPKISISIGVSCYPEFGQLPQDIINSADEAVYEAKANGKNTVCIAGQKKEAPASKKTG